MLSSFCVRGQEDEQAPFCAQVLPVGEITLSQFRNGDLIINNGFMYHVYVSGKVTIHCTGIDLASGKSQTYSLELNKKMRKLIEKRHKPTFAADKNRLYMKLGTFVFQYIQNEGGISLAKTIRLKKDYSSTFSAKGNLLIFHEVYNRKDKDNAFLCRYNWKTNEEVFYQSFDLKFPQYTYIQPAGYISCYEQSILFSQGITYHLDIYDTSGHKTDEIILEDSVHFPLLKPETYAPYQASRRIFTFPKDYIPGLQKLPHKGSRIWRAHFINSSTIMVRFSRPAGGNNYVFADDIWQKENGTWKLQKSVVHEYEKEKLYTCESMWPWFVFNSKFVIADGKLHYLVLNSCDRLTNITLGDLTHIEKMTFDHLNYYHFDFHE